MATPELKTAKVTLPAGLSISPSAAGGLQACSNEQIGLESNEPGTCPARLADRHREGHDATAGRSPLEGQVFLGEPECGTGLQQPRTPSEDASSGCSSRCTRRRSGITIKLPGSVSADPATGQLTATFKENPQLPFSDLELHFKNGPRAPLANPQTCGTFTTVSDLEPWSAPATADRGLRIAVRDHGCAALAAVRAVVRAGTASPAAGAYSPLSVTFSRSDGEQDLGGITVTTHPACWQDRRQSPAAAKRKRTPAHAPPPARSARRRSPRDRAATRTRSPAGGSTSPARTTGAPFGLASSCRRSRARSTSATWSCAPAIAINPTTAALTITSQPAAADRRRRADPAAHA